MAYPVLSRNPSSLDPDGKLEDSTLRSEFTAGYSQSRPKFTRLRRTWGVSYADLPNADADTLRAFESTTLVNGSAPFVWTHPISGITPTVQIIGCISFSSSADKYGVTQVSFTLQEV